jgi:hypothetical protein
MNQQLIQQYYENLQKFYANQMSTQQWYEYCDEILEQLMEENKDVFLRLKNR